MDAVAERYALDGLAPHPSSSRSLGVGRHRWQLHEAAVVLMVSPFGLFGGITVSVMRFRSHCGAAILAVHRGCDEVVRERIRGCSFRRWRRDVAYRVDERVRQARYVCCSDFALVCCRWRQRRR